MSVLVAVDPSVRSSGLAVFRDGVLVDAQTVRARVQGGVLAARCLEMAGEIVLAMPATARMSIDTLAIEWPETYRGEKSETAKANSLATISAVGVAVAALLHPSEIRQYTAKQWARHLKKYTTGNRKDSPRAHRIRSRLEGPEVEVWDALRKTEDDAIDAIGIGLHALGRFSRRRVFAGARSG